MPFYEFKCADCLRLEEKHFGFEEEHKIECDHCKSDMVKVLQPTPTIFRGNGWGGQ